MSKIEKYRQEGNCLPFIVLKLNVDEYLWYAEKEGNHEDDKLDEEFIRIFNTFKNVNTLLIDGINNNIAKIPPLYRDSSKNKLLKLAGRIYNKFFIKNKIDTGKTFMVLHNLILSLWEDVEVEPGIMWSAIDVEEDGYKAILNELHEVIESAADGVYDNKKGAPPATKSGAVLKRYKSATKQAAKLLEFIEKEEPMYYKRIIIKEVG